MNSITQDILYKQTVIKYSYKHGVTKAAIKFKMHRKTIYRWREKYDGTDSREYYLYEGLQPKTTYTINIIARDAVSNEYIGAITQKITTIVVNKPDLTGFNTKEYDEAGNKLPVTYYVEYDENGENPKVGDKITNDGSNMPKGWYDYASNKWANIVVTDGTIESGQIE